MVYPTEHLYPSILNTKQNNNHTQKYCELFQNSTLTALYYIYIYRFIVRFPIELNYLSITFLLHSCLSWTFVKSAISASLSSNWSSGLNSTPYISSPSPHHMSIPSQSTTSNDSCDRLNSNQPSQFFTCPVWRYHTSGQSSASLLFQTLTQHQLPRA